MSDLFAKILLGLLRVLLVPVTEWLVKKGLIGQNDTAQFVTEAASYVIAISWVIWAWVNAHRAQLTAMAMSPGSTFSDLKRRMKSGLTAPVTTPPHEAPALPDVTTSRG